MAENRSTEGSSSMDAKREEFVKEQIRRQKERTFFYAQNVARLRKKNMLTGLAIGSVALGIYGYTMYAIPQEKFLDEMEDEAKVARAQYIKTSAN